MPVRFYRFVYLYYLRQEIDKSFWKEHCCQHRCSQGGAQGARDPPNQNTTNDKKL